MSRTRNRRAFGIALMAVFTALGLLAKAPVGAGRERLSESSAADRPERTRGHFARPERAASQPADGRPARGGQRPAAALSGKIGVSIGGPAR